MRPSWDRYFIEMAKTVATRSTCDRARVGAVLVLDRRILATGYNGAPGGLDHCDDVGHLMVNGHCVRTIHAEVNAILQAAANGVSIEGATLYCTHSPCFNCAKALINARIKRIIFETYYADWLSALFLDESGICGESISMLEQIETLAKSKDKVKVNHHFGKLSQS